MDKLKLKIVTPEKEALSEEVDQVNVPSSDGQLGILPNHSALMAKLVPGELTIKKGNQETHVAVGSGFMEVSKGELRIMTDLAEKAEDIDERAVEEARKRAQEAMEKTLSDEEYADTLAIIERSLAQLKVKRHHHVG